jgi:inosose dehydratase
MRTAVNGTVWGSLSKALGKTYGWQDIVREAAAAGYEGVELGGNEKSLGKPADCLAFVREQGLDIAAFFAGVTYNPWKPNTEQYREAMRYAAELGVTTITVCGGFMPNQRRNTYSFDYDMFAGNLGAAMRYAERLGLEVAFHPHRGCVVETIGEALQMVKRLPRLKFCIDTAHLEACNEDALKFIRLFGKRITATHIKDYSWKQDSFVEPGKGDGKLSVSSCVKLLQKQGYQGWYTIELDRKWDGVKRVPQPLDVARNCRRYLRTCGV